jgi:Domain of unknown function (DUF932)
MSILMKASQQWASRPSDQRFLSLPEMLDHKQAVRENSHARVISSREIEAVPVDGDMRGLHLVGPNGAPVAPTHWSFGQLAGMISAPAKYLTRLPAPLAADCVNYGLLRRNEEDFGVLVQHRGDVHELSAVTGPNYGRVWDADIIAALINRFGDGVTGDFRIPGEFGKEVEVTNSNTTLYASDRDMFVFLADEKNRIENRNRRNGQNGSLARGFFAWNSEVGSKPIGIATFLFDHVCCNRIVWGATEYREMSMRHTSSAPDRWIEKVAPAIEAYAKSSTASITAALENAKQARLDKDVTEFLSSRTKFTRNQIRNMIAAHDADEGRPIETIWDAVTGITAYARGIQHQDQRVDIERQAGKLLDLVA